MVLSAFFESPQHGKPPDSLDFLLVAVCPNSNSDSLGILAPVLSQVLPQNMVLPQNEVYRAVLPQHEVFGSVLQNGVFMFEFDLLQNAVFKFHLSQTEVNITVLPQNGLYNNEFFNYKFFDNVARQAVKNIVNSLLNIGDKSKEFLTSVMIQGAKNLAWVMQILLESFRRVLKMYTWSLSESLTSVRFQCRLIGLLLKQSLFRKHDFALLVHKACHDYQNLCFWPLNTFLEYKKDTHTHIKKELGKSTRY